MSAQISIFTSVAAFASVTGELVTTFGLGAAVDLVMAIILVWCLQQGKTSFNRTSFVLARVIQYTVSTGLATSSVAVAALVAYLVRPNDFLFIVNLFYNPVSSRADIIQAIHFSMGRLYTNTLLATLNSRRNLRQVLEAPSMGRQLGPFMAAMPATNNTSASDETDDIPLNRRPGKKTTRVNIDHPTNLNFSFGFTHDQVLHLRYPITSVTHYLVAPDHFELTGRAAFPSRRGFEFDLLVVVGNAASNQ
ncbi:hypothetical protein DFH06DRAFT_1140116 [Mycena polygramma]|nr:hypothetical protein DFH06DRAFT_1140116 [Mycena polygramma]